MIPMTRMRPTLAALAAVAIATTAAAQDAAATQEAPERAALHAEPRRDVHGPHAPIPAWTSSQYSCGGWIKKNPIPPDQARWDVYGKLTDDNAAVPVGHPRGGGQARSRTATPPTQKIGDYFAACMDEAAIEKAGGDAAQSRPRRHRAPCARRTRWPPLLGTPAPRDGQRGLLFGFGSKQDFADSSQVIAFARAGGLGLPDRDYYAKDDAKSQETREQLRRARREDARAARRRRRRRRRRTRRR